MTTLFFVLSAIALGEFLLATLVGRFLRADDGAFERSQRVAAVSASRSSRV